MKLKSNFSEANACKALFFSISFFVGLWAVRIPDIKDQINVDYTGMGYLFVIFSIGSVLTMIVTPKITQIYPSKQISLLSGLAISILWLLIPFAQSFIIMAILSFIFGICYGLFEVILNVQATSLEKRFKKPMMSGFHAFWSIGLLSGSLLTSLFLEFKISFIINSIIFVIILSPLIFLGSLTIKQNKSDSLSILSIFFNWPLFLVILFILSITAVFLEGGTDSWGSLYMRDYINADGFNIGLAAIAFNGSMVIGRLIGDKLKEIFGIYNFLVYSVIGSLLGSLIIVLSSSLSLAIIGFIIAGFSVSSIIPICYTFGSSIKNVNATVGITIITIGVYGVFMIAPPALGYVADIFGIEFVYIPMLILFIISSIIVTSQQKLFKS